MSERIPDYAQGFKDGFAAGLEEGKKIKEKSYMDGLIEGMKKTLPPPYVPSTLPDFIFGQRDTCPKCGIKISGVMGYVCNSPNCPTFPQVTCGPSTSQTYAMDSFSAKCTNELGYNVKTVNLNAPQMNVVEKKMFRPEDYHPDWIGRWGDRDRGR